MFFYSVWKNLAYEKNLTSCFCNGLEVECKSSDQYYKKIVSDYVNEDWFITNKYINYKESVGLYQYGVYHTDLQRFSDHKLYYIVPSKYNKNGLLAYNGKMSFNYRFDLPEEFKDKIEQLEIRISV